MADVFSSFDLIRIINLATRRDRRAEMLRELDRVGLAGDPRVRFFDAIVPSSKGNWRRIGEHGVFLSHLGILTEASEANRSVLILEDDADFTRAIAEPQPVAEIFYGGYQASNPESLVDSDIIGAHCMGFSAAVAKQLVPFLEGLISHESPPPIDGAYVWFRRAHTDVATSFARPPVATQRSSRSDITPSRLDEAPFLGPALGMFRKARRTLRGFSGGRRANS